MQDRAARARKIGILSRILQVSQITAVFESHGSRSLVKRVFRQHAKSFHLFHATTGSDNAGGLLLFVRRSTVPTELPTLSHPVPGRVARLLVPHGVQELRVWAVHNFGLSDETIGDVCASVRRDLRDAASDPSRVIVFLVGDFNFLPRGEEAAYLATPTLAYTTLGGSRKITGSDVKLAKLLGEMVELQQSQPTHFDNATSSESRLDRGYTSLPGWLLLSHRFQAGTLFDCRWIHKQGVSDHAPVCINFRKDLPIQSGARPITASACKTPLFLRSLESLLLTWNVPQMHPFSRWRWHKYCIREAARCSRNDALTAFPDSPQSRALTYASMGRAVWRNDVILAKNLILRSRSAAFHLSIHDGYVDLDFPEQFEKDFAEAKLAHLKKKQETLEGTEAEAPTKTQITAHCYLSSHEVVVAV